MAMELKDFARQVLFANTLEEKLRHPEDITDHHPGAPMETPPSPGRPSNLQFKPSGSAKTDFPRMHQLDDARERGRLLHFFASHELLATELMALVLLRFPDAPANFRRGVLQTLKDEQRHTRLYIERIRECGIEFGELPVSGYFWRAVAPMAHPVDYVAGLSLTFEQANLDFCRDFARAFARIGDAATSALLDRIYRDEIGHVAYGLKWFRRWKNPQQSDWEAFCRQLKFPLSPQRAKGFTLNLDGRRAAGFDPDFIDQLNIFAQSKGRTPWVFVFNPFAEAYIAYGKAFTPVKQQAQLARDLANLPQFLCRQDDIVLAPNRPSTQFLRQIKEAGFPLPEFIELSSPSAEPERAARKSVIPSSVIDRLKARKLGRLRPWAWGSDAVELFASLWESITGEERAPADYFNDKIVRLYSKAWSAALLTRVLANRPAEPWLCAREHVGVTVDAVDDALAVIDTIRKRGHSRIVVKEAIGLAGHNAIRLFEPDLLPAQRRWIARAVDNRRQLVIEPWLERALDCSVQLEMEQSGLKVRGYTGLITDHNGQFRGNWAAADYRRRIPAQAAALLVHPPDIAARLRTLYADIIALLGAELRTARYFGPVGIDAFVFRTASGQCRLKPIVEVNPRYTMGRVTVELMKRVCPGSHGTFRLVSRAMAKAEGFDDFGSYALSLRDRSPLRLEGEPAPRIRSGMVCLNDPHAARAYLAVFEVRASPPHVFLNAEQDE